MTNTLPPDLQILNPEKPEILNTGRSAFGWSKVGSYLRCPRLYSLSLTGRRKTLSKALIAGSLIHEAMALILHRNSGITAIGNHFGEYITQHHPDPTDDDQLVIDEALDIAVKVTTKMLLENQHLWLFQKFENFEIEQELKLTTIRAGTLGAVHTLETPLTSRIDCIATSRKTGGIWFIDHKTTSFRDQTATFANTLKGYMIDGQFKLQCLIGKENFGDKFQGVVLNFINKKGKEIGNSYAYRLPAYQPETIENFQNLLLETLVKIERSTDKDHFPKVHNQMLCTHKFGTCEYFSTCHTTHDVNSLKLNI